MVSLSIIIPTYNVAGYISETLDSLANQSDHPEQIIIVDDGSTDNTVKVIQDHELATKILLIEQNNQGQGIARNVGIRHATSDYLYFLDSDDLVTDEFITFLKRRIEAANKPDLIFFSGKSFPDKNYSGSKFKPTNYKRPVVGEFDRQKDFLSKLLTTEDLSCSPCLYVSKRSLWQEGGLAFNEFFHEDEELLYRLIFAAQSYVSTSDVYFLRRLRDGSTMTGSKQPKHAWGMKALVTSLLNMADENQGKNLRLKLIRRRLRRFTPSYIICCKLANIKIDYGLVFRAAVKMRSPRGAASILKAFLI